MSEKKHAVFSASGSERWMGCAGSIALSKKAPPQPESPYAVEGTKAHEVFERFNKSKRPYSESFLLKGKYPQEMIDYAFSAFKEVEKMTGKTAKRIAEVKVSLDFVHPDMYGTVDAAIINEFDVLTVIDYKYGAGIPVSPENNSQLIYYALGLAHQYDYNFSHVNLVILQPRAPGQDGSFVKEWKLSIDDLIAWKDKFAAGVKAALAKNPPLTSGDWCKFCPATSMCPELSTKALKQAQIDFDDTADSALVEVDTPAYTELSTFQLARSLEAAERIEMWISGLRAYAFEALKRGEEVPGYKLVPRRAVRKWEDAEKIAALAKKKFGMKAFDLKLFTPAQFEKKVDKAFVEKHAVAISSGVTLAREDDRREAVNQIEQDFAEV